MMRSSGNAFLSAVALAGLLMTGLGARDAAAGCGCTKPPPPPAAVRPSVTYAGTEVSFFDPSIVAGQTYVVTFSSGTSSVSLSVSGQAVNRRDLADAVYKDQLDVKLPYLPLGPTAIDIRAMGNPIPILSLPDSDFTVAPQPVTIPTGVGSYSFQNYRAAVSRDGVVYLSLNFEDIQDARVFDAQALGYPLRFDQDDLTFYNRQGFLMQLLDETIPGLSSIDAGGPTNSDVLHYSRHEFNTHFLQHEERQPHEVDPSDPNWHLDSTPHIDHDHQILEMAGVLDDGSDPVPGPTPAFELVVETHTLFHHGLFGDAYVDVELGSVINSYDSTTGLPGLQGDVLSNGTINVMNSSIIAGDATAATVNYSGGTVTGTVTETSDPTDFLIVEVPSNLTNLGAVFVGPAGLVIPEGSYLVTRLEVDGGTLTIDNSDGPVTIYVDGDVLVDNGGQIGVTDRNPEKFALYVEPGGTVELKDGAFFYGVVYAPEAAVRIETTGEFFGAFVGGEVNAKGRAQIHYDSNLSYNPCPQAPTFLGGVSELSVSPGEKLDIGATALDGTEKILADGLVISAAEGKEGGTALGFEVPADVPVGSDIEVAIVDATGCRSFDTVIVHIVEPPPPLRPPVKWGGGTYCGLIGIEILMAWPIAGVARMIRRRRGRA